MKKRNDNITRKGCLDEELLSRYIYDLVSDNERETIEDHLSRCPFCVEEFIFATKHQKEIVDEKQWLTVPGQVQNHILDMIRKGTQKREDILTIGLRFLRSQLEILHHNGILMAQPALAVRSLQETQAPTKKALYKIINGYHIEADIKKVRDNEIDIQVKIKDTRHNGGIPTGICFTLYTMDKTRTGLHVLEEVIRNGEARFKGLGTGEYCIKIAHKGKEIGSIQLDLTD